MQLSSGPWSYNRFNAYEQSLTEGSKPDYLDFDKDGDKKEPMKKALKEKGKKEVKESNCSTGHQEGGKVEKKSPCEKCKEEGKKDCDCDSDKKSDKKDKMPPWLKGKKDVKEAIMNQLMADGLANNPVSAEIITEHMSEAWAEAILSDLD